MYNNKILIDQDTLDYLSVTKRGSLIEILKTVAESKNPVVKSF
jgi:hypothetical protein